MAHSWERPRYTLASVLPMHPNQSTQTPHNRRQQCPAANAPVPVGFWWSNAWWCDASWCTEPSFQDEWAYPFPGKQKNGSETLPTHDGVFHQDDASGLTRTSGDLVCMPQKNAHCQKQHFGTDGSTASSWSHRLRSPEKPWCMEPHKPHNATQAPNREQSPAVGSSEWYPAGIHNYCIKYQCIACKTKMLLNSQ